MSDTLSARSILIIDDDTDFRTPLAIMLDEEGYRVRCADDGEEGFRIAGEDPPNLIVLDFMMPGKNGFDTCVELAESPRLGHIPVLVLTAFGRDIGEIYGLPASDVPANIRECLEKPVEFNILLERVASALRGA